MMKPRHPAWQTPEPEWMPMAPGIKWLLHYPDAATAAGVATDTAKVLAGTYGDADVMMALANDPETAASKVAGQAAVILAVLYAHRCLIEWEGVLLEDGTPAPIGDPNVLRRAVISEMAPSRPAAMIPLLGWIQGSRRRQWGDFIRLRNTAASHWIDEDPDPDDAPQTIEGIACWDLVLTRPDLWLAETDLHPAGLDYARALIAFEDQNPPDVKAALSADYGAAYHSLRAIEAGRIAGPHNG